MLSAKEGIVNVFVHLKRRFYMLCVMEFYNTRHKKTPATLLTYKYYVFTSLLLAI